MPKYLPEPMILETPREEEMAKMTSEGVLVLKAITDLL
jgi:DNA-binding CsgD family transcriptional regulator